MSKIHFNKTKKKKKQRAREVNPRNRQGRHRECRSGRWRRSERTCPGGEAAADGGRERLGIKHVVSSIARELTQDAEQCPAARQFY